MWGRMGGTGRSKQRFVSNRPALQPRSDTHCKQDVLKSCQGQAWRLQPSTDEHECSLVMRAAREKRLTPQGAERLAPARRTLRGALGFHPGSSHTQGDPLESGAVH